MNKTEHPSDQTDTPGVVIRVLPSESMLVAFRGQTYLDVLRKNGFDVPTDCGGNGTCGKCWIRFVGSPPDPAPADRRHIKPEDLASGRRLACMHRVAQPTTIQVAFGRLDEGTPHRSASGWGAERTASDYGIAIDIGTTTLTAALFDLATRVHMRSASMRNPQGTYGADVIARIAHVRCEGEAGLQELHLTVVSALTRLIARLCGDLSVPTESIRKAVVVGNPTMLHLFLNVSPVGIGMSPFVPAFTDAVRRGADAIDLGVDPQGVIETLPAVSAYVGADIVAGLLVTRFGNRPTGGLFLDVGTNGEIVLSGGERMYACSTAAGPAFEGASIVQGMLASPGAIESVRVHDGGVTCGVIEDVMATGMCGTGLLSAVAGLLRVGLIDPSGRFRQEGSALSGRFEGEGQEARFRLTDGSTPVYLYQRDVRELQLAKAAIRTGIEVILSDSALAAEDVDEVLVAGAFSSGLAESDLAATGLLPPIAATRVRGVGNAAVRGAAQVLLDEDQMSTAKRLAEKIDYVELSSSTSFKGGFVRQLRFPDS